MLVAKDGEQVVAPQHWSCMRMAPCYAPLPSRWGAVD
jgi:hypothetical protein